MFKLLSALLNVAFCVAVAVIGLLLLANQSAPLVAAGPAPKVVRHCRIWWGRPNNSAPPLTTEQRPQRATRQLPADLRAQRAHSAEREGLQRRLGAAARRRAGALLRRRHR